MLKNYIVTILRGIGRNKVFTIINLLGLSIAMACFILVGLYVKYELSYDKFHDRVEDIHIVKLKYKKEMGGFLNPFVPAIMSKAIEEAIPGVEAVTAMSTGAGTIYVKNGDSEYTQEKYYQARSSFFSVFSFPFLHGSESSALDEPNAIVISSEMALRYFNTVDVVGNFMTIDKKGLFKVTGVLKPFPANSQFQPNFILPLDHGTSPERLNSWQLNSFFVYLKVAPDTDIQRLENDLSSLYESKSLEGSSFEAVGLGSFSETYWDRNSSILNNRSRGLGSDKNVIYVFSGLAFLLLFIALANYVNMAIAKSISRAKEVGVRKVNGASQNQLRLQFLAETIFFSFLCLISAVILVEIMLPSISEILGVTLQVDYGDLSLILTLLVYTLVCGLLAGLYPAFLLARFNPVKALKGDQSYSKSRFSHRSVLLFLQFTISSVLIAVLLMANAQIRHYSTFDLGFEKAQVISIGTPDTMRRSSEYIIQQLKKMSGVEAVAIGPLPNGIDGSSKVKYNDIVVKNVSRLHTDEGFLPMMEINLESGRNFDLAHATDFKNAIIINRELAKRLQLENPVGSTIEMSGLKKEVIGVVNDFYAQGAVSRTGPLILFPSKNRFSRFMIKVNPENMSETLKGINSFWSNYDPRNYFKYQFLDEAYAKRFSQLERITLVINGVTVAIVTISLFGLFSLVLFQVTQKIKEIGIRKVLGASVAQILMTLGKPYVWVISFSTLAAIPLSYFFMNQVLNKYPNRIDLDSSFGIMTVVLVLVFSGLIIISRTLMASRANPVDVLRNE